MSYTRKALRKSSTGTSSIINSLYLSELNHELFPGRTVGTKSMRINALSRRFRVIRDIIMHNVRPTRPTNEGGCSQWMSDALWKLITDMWAEKPANRPSMQLVHATLLELRHGPE
jgi:hypothetical protein